MKIFKILGKVVTVGAVAGGVAGLAYYSKKSVEEAGKMEGRYKAYYQLTNQWLASRNEGKSVNDYFRENNIKTIAIYGMGTLGELLVKEIDKTEVTIQYIVDKNAEEIYIGSNNIPIIGINDLQSREDVDALIITPIFDFDEIMDDIMQIKEDMNMVSLEDIIYGI